mmetsp:Transcript_33652/g.82559  ORF Transcript_33652/g.82559 Transcript_33652/m.82559 type:complete len:209 (-) Transcript_33652:232-858(-)|eukprot:CAMPEP_0197575728 /NCGR_PEP_ID=MMETSP1326-20131121/1025_1 /TAXON_ID=1155430 /ORGANISM="Genus nov. species nov., Strain RCC2288" /LENGTH=208 /DNA_ID=CAMNT_0043138543 /DNA_START=241 /DNA_END=867 /DNA_ORIENTATION=+
MVEAMGLSAIDLVAHLYSGSGDDRRALNKIWDGYSAKTEDERKKPGFELVRLKHQALSRGLRDESTDGPGLDLDDLRLMWEEFVDALRDATGAAAEDIPDTVVPNSYESLEFPVMKKNASFACLVSELSGHVSTGSTPEGSTRGIKRISSLGMLVGFGASSREPSTHGGSLFAKAAAAEKAAGVDAANVAEALEKLVEKGEPADSSHC